MLTSPYISTIILFHTLWRSSNLKQWLKYDKNIPFVNDYVYNYC
ncbi:hypothetical protein HMPREF9420_0241 [Segatella salivae DSM 15606]|uniref:Uncharacterized protein n=1 Tax=Segatella salivae DSM 15606 TaxID=888832 RepID=E6ML74_9BACT|nr:hypothetical protein HMPREF9420_0241 [Segatella salivae DSM 15606]